MKKLLLAGLLLLSTPAWGQNPTCPTRAPGDNTNACASTAFVQEAISAFSPSSYIDSVRLITSQTYTWPSAIPRIIWSVNGSGGPGNSSAHSILAGAGGGGAFAMCKMTRPTSGLVRIRIDPGRSAIPAGTSISGSSVNGLTYIREASTVTLPIASPGVVTWTGHGFSANWEVVFTTTGALPTGLTAGTSYYVVAAGLTANTFQVSATPGGAAINFTGSQSGTHWAEGVTRQCACGSAHVGGEVGSAYVGADGGVGGVCPVDALFLVRYVQGGLGMGSGQVTVSADPSLPLGTLVNAAFPKGGQSPFGGDGGGNFQMGTRPGGGGAPGNQETTPQNPAASRIATASIVSGGTGCAIGDLIELSGSWLNQGTLQVSTVSAGVITGVSVIQTGSIEDSVRPSNPLTTAAAGPTPTCTGATFNLTWAAALDGDGSPGGHGEGLGLWIAETP
jgi:hypothetical protein